MTKEVLLPEHVPKLHDCIKSVLTQFFKFFINY